MRNVIKEITSILIILSVIAGFAGCSFLDEFVDETTYSMATISPTEYGSRDDIDEDGSYYTKDDVALYLYLYGHLPPNYMTKSEAQALGWENGDLDEYEYGACIGGDRFYNYEGYLPEEDGREYFECDVDTLHQDSRGPKRIVYSDDGLIYYTEDHYATFVLLYGEP